MSTLATPDLRLLVVDDHPVVRMGLRSLIRDSEGLEMAGEASSVAEALRLLEEVTPDLVLLDLSLEGPSGLELVKQLAQRAPELPVLVLSVHDEAVYGERALEAGAQGFVMKTESPEVLREAISRVLEGEVYLSERMTARVLARMQSGEPRIAVPEDVLTDREIEVYRHIGEGRTTREIAGELGLSVKTIETYRRNVKQKLGFDNAAQLARGAACWVQAQAGLAG